MTQLFAVKTLIIEYLCHLGVHPAELGEVLVVHGGGVGAVDGVLVAFEGHGGVALLVVGAAKEVVGKEAVVGVTVTIEELDVGQHVLRSEGLVGAVARVDAVEAAAHAVALGLGGAADKRGSQQGNIYNKV